MNLSRTLVSAAIAAAAFAAFPAGANTLTFQGVTFETMALDADTLQLSVLNATSATGNWTGINYLKAFELKDIGNVTGATLAGWCVSVANRVIELSPGVIGEISRRCTVRLTKNTIG